MRVDDYIDFCGQARGLSGSRLKERKGFVVDFEQLFANLSRLAAVPATR